MDSAAKIARLKAIANPMEMDNLPNDTVLSSFLDTARDEILSWLYNGSVPDGIADVPTKYENVQVMAVIVGLGLSGVEGQTSHGENGVSRVFKYSDMLEYIKRNVIPVAEVI